MIYQFEDHTLDASTRQLFRQSRPLKVPKRVFDCLLFLIQHSDRAVSRDELIRSVWGRDNVSDHQLAQLVLAARHLLNDDGNTQRLIRTVPGLGYHWVGEVHEFRDRITEPKLAVVEQAPELPASAELSETTHPTAPSDTTPHPHAQMAVEIVQLRAAKTVRKPVNKLRVLVVLGSITFLVTSIGLQMRQPEMSSATIPPMGVALERERRLALLDAALWQGKYEEVRVGLATLPIDIADSREARLLEIRLDIERGRFERATEKLVQEQVKARPTNDVVWQAKLLSTQSLLSGAAGRSGEEILAPAQQAVNMLESAGHAIPAGAMGLALSARGYGLMKTRQLQPAMRDLVRARALLLKAGDMQSAAFTADSLVRVQMRMGRLTDALALTTEIADYCQQSGARVQEIYARNAATKIQVELLRWHDALASSDRAMQLLQAVPDSERRARVMQLRVLVLTGMGRLREAASLIEEGEVTSDDRYSSIVPATYHLVSGQSELALDRAEKAFFQTYPYDNLNLESKEGALLLWVSAAQALADKGKALPVMPTAQREALQRPESTVGRIALGRWLWSQGKYGDAERELRLALTKASQDGHLFMLLRASEPLIEFLLQRGDKAGAEQVLAELHGYDPQRVDRDFRVNLLNLRVALALGRKADIQAAYKKTMALAGERALPLQVMLAYRTTMGMPSKHKSVKNAASG